MFKGWRMNLMEKITALATALVLTLYVQAQLHPIVEKRANVPIEFLNRPQNFIVTLPEINTVEVKAKGVKSNLEMLNLTQVRATVDLSGAKPGDNRLPINLRYPRSWKEVADLSPSVPHVRVNLATRVTVRMPVEVVLRGRPGSDQVEIRSTTEPSVISLSGAEEYIKSVKQVAVYFDLDGVQGDTEMDIAPTALSADGNQVLQVQSNPSQVRVKVQLMPMITGKTLPINPQIKDLPAFPYKIAWFSIEPPQARVTGSASLLNKLNVVETEPISFADVRQDTDRFVNLIVPNGLKIDGNSRVKIRVRVEKVTDDTPDNGGTPPDKAGENER